MQYVIFLPALLALWVALRSSPQRAFLVVYLPALLLLPDTFRAITPGIPDPNFNQAIALAIAAAMVLRSPGSWKISATDALVLGFAALVGYSEYAATNYADAQNLMFAMLASVVLPYIFGKALIEPHGARAATAKIFVLCVFAVVLLSLYEFRFGSNPYIALLGEIFPGQGNWITTFRYGFARIAGPYGHCILAGIVMAAAWRLNRWLEWGGHWEGRFRFAPWLPWPKATVIRYALLAGSIMTLARGPWLGALAGAIPVMIGRSRKRRQAVLITLSAITLVGIPAAVSFYSYVNVDYMQATSASQESAAYRKALVDRYIDIAVDKSLLGWGKNGWPKVPGMPSIDNHFMLIALMHGLIALSLFVVIFLWVGARLMRRGLRAPPTAAGRNDFAFALAGIFLAIFVSIGTVYMGEQVLPIFFLLAGWAESYLGRAPDPETGNAPATSPPPRHRFKRVIA